MSKWWVRLIISFVAGGVISEAAHLLTNGEIKLNAFIFGIAIFIILTFAYSGIQFYRGMTRKEKSREDFEIEAMEKAFVEADKEYDEYAWKTPISGCDGYVSFIDNGEGESFYGCGETGAIWRSKEAFYRDIESIISKYPHRKHFYEFKDGEWIPVNDVSEEIEDMIETEDEETLTDYEKC